MRLLTTSTTILFLVLALATMGKWATPTSVAHTPRLLVQAEPLPDQVKSKKRPNVLIIVSDDQPDHTLSAMPATRKFFARSGIIYPNAYASTALCCPARASIMTGQHVHNHGIAGNNSQATKDFPFKRSLQWQLQQHGYQTALFGKFLNGWSKKKEVPGWDIYRSNDGHTMRGDWQITGWAKKLIASGRRPWFALLGYHSPHGPWTAGGKAPPCRSKKAWREKDLSDKPPYVRRQAESNTRRGKDACQGQLRELAALDRSLSSLFTALKKSGQRKRTMVFFISDQGFMWGQNGGLIGKFLPYRGVLEVPMMFAWPQGLAAQKDQRLVSSIDIAPTIYHALGISPGYRTDGCSLLARHNQRDWLYAEMERTERNPPWSALINRKRVVIETYSEKPFVEYYNMVRDPWQRFSHSKQTPPSLLELLRGQRNCRGPKQCR